MIDLFFPWPCLAGRRPVVPAATGRRDLNYSDRCIAWSPGKFWGFAVRFSSSNGGMISG